ncbi:2C-methyl-D-erythritol 2,4-cyclodiphosphate synthase, putative (IspF) [Plasmodium ovale wallikeri]|uniref:2-C-methyl-D-erythritol 2,4-cyclodiphosphate synthase n=1 Tax=Plasmodium ovale wallikeri TaxID=864142 RepID=A0A1A8YJL1_PLAOA|nr:2C-methyl-D-erythritol 2,4-cyclodiphosphate synthase, putative (IspF) [Plasmodium ovale wallikeri]
MVMCCRVVILTSPLGWKRYIQKRDTPVRAFLPLWVKKNNVVIYKKKKKKKRGEELGALLYNGIRIGQGYDIHKIKVSTDNDSKLSEDKYSHEENKGQCFKMLTMGGVKIRGISVLSHSDGDVVYHALVDAILGALGSYDLGTLFPDRDEKYRDKSSSSFLRYARLLLYKSGYSIGNIDINVIAEVPKISPIRRDIVRNVSTTLRIAESQISLKGGKLTKNSRKDGCRWGKKGNRVFFERFVSSSELSFSFFYFFCKERHSIGVPPRVCTKFVKKKTTKVDINNLVGMRS